WVAPLGKEVEASEVNVDRNSETMRVTAIARPPGVARRLTAARDGSESLSVAAALWKARSVDEAGKLRAWWRRLSKERFVGWIWV
ncbi:MAG: hypothetical protein ACPGYV_09975, partial [Phycisphaeraceae bacterium]